MSNNMECAAYFKSRPEYKRCFDELRKKWKSFGRAAGRITLANASQEECRGIGGIVGRTCDEGTVRFSVAEFEAGLQRTRFAPVELGEVLACYFGEELFTNQEQKRREQEKKEQFFEKLIGFFEGWMKGVPVSGTEPEGLNDFFEKQVDGAECSDSDGSAGLAEQLVGHEREHAVWGDKGSPAAEWLRLAVSTKKFGYQLMAKEYARDASDAESLIKAVGRALNTLASEGIPDGWREDAVKAPEAGRLLAVFAANISGNPHYFDRGTTPGQLLVHAICFQQGRELPGNAYEWRELLLGFGLIPDNVSSSVHAYGLRLRTGDGYHPAYEAFCARREPCVVTLENLRDVVGAEAVGNSVYVVENEMVFSYLAERVKGTSVTLLCTSGQPRSAALELFSFLAASGIKINYSGDIDPEGIDIADRLWQRYGEAIRIWRMEPADYGKSISAEAVDETRLAKLDHIKNPLLRETARCVREKQRAGYQENLLEELVWDVRECDCGLFYSCYNDLRVESSLI